MKPDGTVELITTNSLLLSPPSLAKKIRGVGGGLTWKRTTLMMAGKSIAKEASRLRYVVRQRSSRVASLLSFFCIQRRALRKSFVKGEVRRFFFVGSKFLSALK